MRGLKTSWRGRAGSAGGARGVAFLIMGAVAIAAAWWTTGAGLTTVAGFARAAEPAADDPALARARKQVRMLDDLYKTSIVVVTQTYVAKDTDVAAAVSFRKVFEAMKKKGYHEARLIDASGQPYNPDNVAKDDFEKSAIKEILGGQGYVDAVETKEGKRYLRAATAVPVVMQKCVLCHENYKNTPEGQAIGVIGYRVPVE